MPTSENFTQPVSDRVREAESRELRENLVEGLKATYESLIAEKKKNNEVLVFSKGGALKKVKATDI